GVEGGRGGDGQWGGGADERSRRSGATAGRAAAFRDQVAASPAVRRTERARALGRLARSAAETLMTVPFVKGHGLGNDYIVMEETTLSGPLRAGQSARRCDRDTGGGADGDLLRGA